MSVDCQRFNPGRRDAVSIVQEAGWIPRLLQTGTENLARYWESIFGPTSPRKSLHRLRYNVLVPDIKYQSYQH